MSTHSRLRRGVAFLAAVVIVFQLFVNASPVVVRADDEAVSVDQSVFVAPTDVEAPVVEAAPEVTVEESGTSEATAGPEVVVETAPTEEVSAPVEATVDAPVASAPSVAVDAPTLTTDKDDYAPGETVNLFGRFFHSFEQLFVRIFGNSEVGNHFSDTTVSVTTDADGSFSFAHQLDNFYRPAYDVTVTGIEGDQLAAISFTDAPQASGNLDQCANGSSASPVPCTGSAWQNGNLNSNQAHYMEGGSAPYRIVLSNVPTSGTNTLVIEYDVKNGGKHAIDFLTSYDRTEVTANPCSGVSGCSGAGSSYPIPVPAGLTSSYFIPGQNFNIHNGSISSVGYLSQGDLNSAQSSTQVQIQFTATNSTVVLAWGGHIATSSNWGAGQSAGGISGSPYHMRFIELNGKGGNQDRSLSAGAITVVQKATLTLVKQVVNNDGGAALPTAWTLSATGPTSISGTTGSAAVTAAAVDGGTYTLSESGGPAGYAPSAWSCTAGTLSGNSLTLAAGQTAVCTIVNDDIDPIVTVVKHVINDNGGTKVASDFAISVTGPDVSPASFVGSESGTIVTLDAGSYTVTEVTDPGYTATYSAGCSGTLGLGGTATCTITNDDKPGTLVVKKVVVNDNGGTKTASDFSFSVNGGSTTSFEADGQNDLTVNAGSYSVVESAATGYTTTYSNCSNVVVANGGTATCTITNDDQPGTLHVVKVLNNAYGSTANFEDFSFSVGNAASQSFDTDGTNDFTVDAGNYSVVETATPGWTTSYDNCANVAITNGGEATCTITNDPIQPKLIVIKHVINDNGGTKVAGDFTMSVIGTNVSSSSFPGAELGTTIGLDVGAYQVQEFAPTGYQGSVDADCIGSIALGQTKTCTITNNDIAPRLTVIKHVINDDGDDAQASDFVMHLTGTSLSSNDFAGSETGVTVTLNAGAYTADEASNAGYIKTLSADCSGTIVVGETKTCTITNNDKPHATRTQGFWQTHTNYTTTVFGFNSWTIGGHVVNSTSKLFAGFYANISKTSTGAKRSAIDQARMQMLQQWLATKLNCQAFGCTLATQAMLTNAAVAWNSGTIAQIQSYASQLDAYNNSNDALVISGQGKATPTTSQAQASSGMVFWNVLP